MDLLTDHIPTFLLAGQSNMAGGVLVEDLPEELTWPESVNLITDEGLIDPSALPKGGPEWGMALLWHRLKGDAPCLMVKYALGGKNLANEWNPAGSIRVADEPEQRDVCWPRLLQAVEHANAWAKAVGVHLNWSGFAWMQGERDSVWPGMSAAYKPHMKDLLYSVRELTSDAELPAVIGLITPKVLVPTLDRYRHQYRERVRDAQRKVAKEDTNTSLVETDDLPQKADNLHFNTLGSLVLGQRMMATLLGEPETALPFGGTQSS